MRAYVKCNGTPEDLRKVWNGSDDPQLTRLVVSFYMAEQQYETHSRDVLDLEIQRRRDSNA